MFLFFSIRRRHTRYWRDWSSDVCSFRSRWHQGGTSLHQQQRLPEERVPGQPSHLGVTRQSSPLTYHGTAICCPLSRPSVKGKGAARQPVRTKKIQGRKR